MGISLCPIFKVEFMLNTLQTFKTGIRLMSDTNGKRSYKVIRVEDLWLTQMGLGLK